MKILITGNSGFIGSHLVKAISGKHEIIGMSLMDLENSPGITNIKGEFNSFEELRKLDKYEIDAVIHLAGILAPCSEEGGLETNVMGTRRLLRYLIDRGCRKFVLASSIAATGCLSEEFIPLQLPIPDDHPCLASDMYGFSKAMVEMLTHFFNLMHPDTEFINLRFGAVRDFNVFEAPLIKIGTSMLRPFLEMANVDIEDIVTALMKAVESTKRSGVHTYNVLGPDASCDDPTLEVLKNTLWERVSQFDLSFYKKPGMEYYPVYSIEKIKKELGFVPVRTTQPGKIARSFK